MKVPSSVFERPKQAQQIVVILFALLVGLASVFVSQTALLYFIALIISGVLLLAIFKSPVLLLYFIILTSAVSSILRVLDSFSLGNTSLSLSGLRWILVVGLIAAVLFLARRVPFSLYMWPFVIFAAYTAVRMFFAPTGLAGTKDVLFFLIPFAVWMYTRRVVKNRTQVMEMERLLLLSIYLPIFIYVILLATGLVQITNNGPKGLIEPRAIATYLVVFLPIPLARWRYAPNRAAKNAALAHTLIILAFVLFTLSRMASLTAILLVFLSRTNPRRLIQTMLIGLIAATLGVSLLMGIPSFRNRFFHRTPTNVEEAFLYINLSGRNKMWAATLQGGLEKPLVGWGPGSARLLVAEIMGKGAVETLPHNEYLQTFHDLGLIGLSILLLAWIPYLIKYWKGWRRYDRAKNAELARFNMAVHLSILAVLIIALIGNPFHYAFILAPLFVLTACTDFLVESNRSSMALN